MKKTGTELSKQEFVNLALAFVENEIIFKHGLMEKPSSNVSVLRSGQIPKSYKRFITTVVKNLVPKDHQSLLPRIFQFKDSEHAPEDGDHAEFSSDEEHIHPSNPDDEPHRKNDAKRALRSAGDEVEIDLLATNAQ